METTRSRTFRIEMGLNLKAATIPRTNPNMRLFPLQNALIDVTRGEAKAVPAWYSWMYAGDRLSFRLVDITRSGGQEATTIEPALVKLSFTDPDTGLPENPFVEDVGRWRISDHWTYRWSPPYSRGADQELPTWDLSWSDGLSWREGTLTLSSLASGQQLHGFEMAVAIRIHRDGWTDQYVFDPEMIVGERGGPDGKI